MAEPEGGPTGTTGTPASGSWREQVSAWLAQEGWKLQEVPPAGQAAWVLEGQDLLGRPVNVLQMENRPDALLVYSSVSYSDDEAGRLASLDAHTRDEFLWDVRFRLLTLGVWFSGVEIPLRQIMVNRTLYTEGLTRRSFMEEVGLIQRALLAIVWTFRRRMGEQPAPDEAMPVN